MKVIILAATNQLAEDLHAADMDVLGTYVATINDAIPNSTIAAVALEGFLSFVAVKVPEDFDFSVHHIKTGVEYAQTEDDNPGQPGLCTDVEKVSTEICLPAYP